MKLKRHNDFINESKKDLWVHEGDFEVDSSMIKDGRFIEGKIPDKVIRDFHCHKNQLTSLEGGPKEVGRSFYCSYNQLTILVGAPEKVGGIFYCGDNQLTSLEGGPKEVGGNFSCISNKLTSLEGAPEKVNGSFGCGDNQLTSLEGGPKEVSRNYSCVFNQLTSLEGAPKKVGGSFNCTDNKFNLEIEIEFIESGSYITDYWKDLLSWMVSNGKNIEDVKVWPEGFLDSTIGRNAKKIDKFGI